MTQTSLLQRLGLSENIRVVSIVGSGGKTTLLYALAREALKNGERPIVTTTTHILRPSAPDLLVIDGEDLSLLEQAWKKGLCPVVGRTGPEGKLSSPSPACLDALVQQGDRVLIEADGSRQLPLKFPNATEPVIHPSTQRVILVVGLSGLGKPLPQVCHRWELACQQLGLPIGKVSLDTMERLLVGGYWKFHPVVLLNQADTLPQKIIGNELMTRLSQRGAERILIVSLKKEVPFDDDSH